VAKEEEQLIEPSISKARDVSAGQGIEPNAAIKQTEGLRETCPEDKLNQQAQPDPWASGLDALYSRLSSSQDGLKTEEAQLRLRKHGFNEVPAKDRRQWLEILVSQFTSPLLFTLMGASLISGFLGEFFDAMIIMAVILVSSLMGFFQEYKSEKIVAQLTKFFSYRAKVLRDGQKLGINSRELVPGDIVFVELGDVVPADLRIIEARGVAVNESVLTGESKEALKDPGARPRPGANPQEVLNGLFMGSTVNEGSAKCLVVATGTGTFFGKTVATFSAKVPESDFQTGIRKFGDAMLKIVLALALVVFLVNFGLGHGEPNPFVDSLLFALAFAVGIVPEMLPIIVTITLSSGSLMLAAKKVITKKLAAIEDLGNMDVLCTDKTGTLTEDEIVVAKWVDLDKRDSHDVFEYALLCGSAVGRIGKITGKPVDVAIRKRAEKEGIDVSRFKKRFEVPFDYDRRRMSVAVSEGRKTYLITKGSSENVLKICANVKMAGALFELGKKEKEIRAMLEEYHARGFSTIAVAYGDIEARAEYSPKDEKGLTLIGFVLFTNPPKLTARETLVRLKSLGIRLKILTGDDPLVAQKLCADVGFKPSCQRIVLGSELEKMKQDELSAFVEHADIFARVTPSQKLLIVETLRVNGHVVGFMGDGINDAPALRTADVGISVESATDVAKEASHIILLRKSLRVVCDGVEAGRKIFGNIIKYILITMSSNGGNMITVALSSFFLPFLPLLPAQILLNNFISDLPLLSVATDNVDKEYTRRPQRWDIAFILKFMLFFGLISTVFDIILIAALYFFMGVDVRTLRTAWFLESLLSEIVIIFSLRTYGPFFKSMPSRELIAVALLTTAVSFGVVYVGPAAALFDFVPLSSNVLFFTLAILVGYFAATEFGKGAFFYFIVPTTPHPLSSLKKIG